MIESPGKYLLKTVMPALWLHLLFAVLFTGCAKVPGTIQGKVTLQGMPVTMGTVTAIGADNIPRSAMIQVDGGFMLKDVPLGKVRVTVESPDPMTVSSFDSDAANATLPTPTNWRKLPEKFASFETSGLIYEICSGANSIEIELN